MIARPNRQGLFASAMALTLAFVLGGCFTTIRTNTTRAYSTVSKPAPGSDNYAEWSRYYMDQFADNGYKTDPPPASGSETQKKAYNDAKLNWDQYISMVTRARNEGNIWFVGAFVGTIVASILVLIL